MPRYQYIAIAADGRKTKGAIAAENPYAARKQLRIRSIHPTSLNEITSHRQTKAALLSLFGKTSKSHLIDFTKQMATLLNSGIKLTEALSVLILQTSDTRFKNAISDIRDRVITGESFTDALKDYGDYFDVIYVSMVRVGEVTGSLGGSLKIIADFMEKRQRIESKVITAMIYPIVLILFCVAAVLFLTIKVIPTVAAQIEKTGQELPWITRQMMNASHTLTSWRLIIVIAAATVIVYLVKRFLKTSRGSYLRDKSLLSLPMFGSLIRQRVVARFASTLSTLLGSGLPMAESLRVVAEVTPLQDSGVIDPAIAHMVTVGEKSGELETMLKNISENLEASTDVVIERLSAAVEPVIIVVMALIVGVIAYATIVPILQLSAGRF